MTLHPQCSSHARMLIYSYALLRSVRFFLKLHTAAPSQDSRHAMLLASAGDVRALLWVRTDVRDHFLLRLLSVFLSGLVLGVQNLGFSPISLFLCASCFMDSATTWFGEVSNTTVRSLSPMPLFAPCAERSKRCYVRFTTLNGYMSLSCTAARASPRFELCDRFV